MTVNGTLSAGGVTAGALVGTLSTGALTLNSNSIFREDVTNANTSDLIRSSSVNLTGTTTLDLQFVNGFVTTVGQRIALIDNTGSTAVSGRFSNYTLNGAGGGTISSDNLFMANGRTYQITYTGTATNSSAGNDVILTDYTAPPSSDPGPSTMPSDGPDQLPGTPGDNTIVGMDGADTISGGDGNDLLFGNMGDDSVDAGSGSNTVYGGTGDDQVTGGAGNDLLFGNEGADTISAGDGDNTIVGGQDSTDGSDLITAGAGNDVIFGNGGNDSIAAGAGNDSVIGGIGDDVLVGGMGNDTLYGNEGNDTIYGNEGSDRLVFGTNSGNDLVQGFSSNEGDRLDLQGQTYTTTTDANGNAVLTLSGGGMVTLAGIAANQVNAAFFA